MNRTYLTEPYVLAYPATFLGIEQHPCVQWLHLPKWLSLPVFVHVDSQDIGGLHLASEVGREVIVGNRVLDMSCGLMLIGSSGHEAGTVAHEMRHHWQRAVGITDPPVMWSCPDATHYRDAIVDFFRRSRTERDALRFELRVAPEDEWAAEWYSWLSEA